MITATVKKYISINCKSTTYALAAIVLPNLIFYIASSWLGVYRPLFNIDYALAATLFAFNRLWFGFYIAFLCSVFDAFQIINQVYPST